ncbi:hypothetical protein O181_125901 [Austropuccinia psidii MF-1]|uniref:CCHC-type domain-containing protein n=1 Tax=Austropuccinia psidii MF-1 TaxID=1389203 RepID=A0A9Q3KTB0_9BASI|nr:hypothetical protein [Austropuccinia psidii MF-1]
MTPTRSGSKYSIQSNGSGPGYSSHKSKRQECQPREEAQMEDARPSTSSQRLESTFDNIIGSPGAEITAITVVRPRNWYKPPVDNNTSGKPIPKPNKPHDKAPLKCHKCGSTYHLANTCPKKTRINWIEIEKDETKETNDVSVHESDSEHSEEEELPDELSIENINVSFEVTEVHNHLPRYSDECMDLIHVQDAKMQKTKPARGKVYTDGSSCITNFVINNRETKIHLESGAFCTCVGNNYLDKIYTN